MTKQEKIEAIKKAIEDGKVTRRQIDSSDCRKSKKILEGKTESLKEKVIDEMYSKLLSIFQRKPSVDNRIDKQVDNKLSTKEDTPVNEGVSSLDNNKIDNNLSIESEKPISEKVFSIDNREVDNKLSIKLIEELETLKTTVNKLSGKVENLDIENKKLREEIEKKRETITREKGKTKELFGFCMAQRKTGGNNSFWYAGRRFDEKLIWVYIGKDISQAKAKIESWLKENHPEVLAEK